MWLKIYSEVSLAGKGYLCIIPLQLKKDSLLYFSWLPTFQILCLTHSVWRNWLFFSQFEITASKVQQYQPKFNSSVSHSLTWSVDLLALYLVYASAERRKKKSNQSSSLMLLIYCDSTSQADIGNTYSVKSMEERKEENFSRKNLHSTVLSTCLSFFLYFQGLLNWVGISLKCILFLNTK